MVKNTNNTPSTAMISRLTAAAAGLSRFFTGEACKYGHIVERFVSSGACVICRYAWKNNKSSDRYKNEKRNRSSYDKNWVKNNPEKVKLQWKRQRDKRKKLSLRAPNFSLKKHVIFDLVVKQKGKCGNCLVYLDGKFHLDHIRPLALNGGESKRNFQLLCVACNIKKSAHDPIDFAQKQGRLL